MLNLHNSVCHMNTILKWNLEQFTSILYNILQWIYDNPFSLSQSHWHLIPSFYLLFPFILLGWSTLIVHGEIKKVGSHRAKCICISSILLKTLTLFNITGRTSFSFSHYCSKEINWTKWDRKTIQFINSVSLDPMILKDDFEIVL